jgi:hypothetical protein
MTATNAIKEKFLSIVSSSAIPFDPPPSAEVIKKRLEAQATAADDYSPAEKAGRGADRLIPLLSDMPLFLEKSLGGFGLFNGRLYRLDPKEQELCQDLGFFYYNATGGKSLSKEGAGTAINYYAAKSRREGTQIKLHNRMAERDGALLYDLGNGRAVSVNNGNWQILTDDSLLTLFRSLNHQLPQPDPVRGGNPWKIFDFLRIAEESRLIALITLVSAFVCLIRHPAILFIGGEGSGKSLNQSFWMSVIDPSNIMLSLMPRKIEDLPLLLSRNYVTNLDNIASNLPGDVADLFCAVITGGVLETRQLHTDSEMIAREVSGIITFSSITTFSDRSDFNERLMRLHCERKPEAILWRDFNDVLPEILGGIFDVLSRALEIYPMIEGKLERLPRLASFATYGYAIAEAIGEGRGNEFLAAYAATMNRATADLMESNTFLQTIVDYMESGKKLDGTFNDVLLELRKHYVTDEESTKNEESAKMLDRDKTFPSSARAIRRALERLRVPLLNLAIEFKIYDGENRPHKSKGKAWITFYQKSNLVDQEPEVPENMPDVLDNLPF